MQIERIDLINAVDFMGQVCLSGSKVASQVDKESSAADDLTVLIP